MKRYGMMMCDVSRRQRRHGAMARMLRHGVLALLALLASVSLLIAASHEALAQDAVPVYLLDTTSYKGEVSSIVPPKIDSTLKDRLGGRPRVKVVPRYSESSGGTTANAAIQQAMEAYNSGIGLLVAEDFEGASKAFKKAVDLFEANLASVDSYEVVTDAQLRLGLAYLKAGYELDARTAFKTYANLNPAAKLSPKDYPPELVEDVEKEIRRMSKRGGGKLTVGSNPEGAEVLLDGAVIGMTPLSLDSAPSGTHYLVVRGKGSFPWGQKITIRGKGELEEFVANLNAGSTSDSPVGEGPVFLSELDRRIKAGEVDPSLTPYFKELASRTNTRAVVFVVMKKGKSGRYDAWPFIYHAENDQIALLDTVSFDASLSTVQVDGYKLAEAIANGILSFPTAKVLTGSPFEAEVAVVTPKDPVGPIGPGPGDPTLDPNNGGDPPLEPLVGPVGPTGPEEPPRPSVDDDDKWYNSWWVWTGLSVVVVSGAVAGGVVLMSDDEPAPARGFSASVSW